MVYAARVAGVATLGAAAYLRHHLGTASVVGAAIISLGIGAVLGGIGVSVPASFPGTHDMSEAANHGFAPGMKDWGEFRPASKVPGASATPSTENHAVAAPPSDVVGGPVTDLLAGTNSTGAPSGDGAPSYSSMSVAFPQTAPAPASLAASDSQSASSAGSPTASGSVAGGGTQPTTRSSGSGSGTSGSGTSGSGTSGSGTSGSGGSTTPAQAPAPSTPSTTTTTTTTTPASTTTPPAEPMPACTALMRLIGAC